MDVGKMIRCGIAAAAWCVLSGSMAARRTAATSRGGQGVGRSKAAGHSSPIVETHIQLLAGTRPGGVPWPTPRKGPSIGDVLPGDYTPMRRRTASSPQAIVEASGIVRRKPMDPRSGEADSSIRSTSEISRSERRPSAITWSGFPKIGAGSGSAAISRAARGHHA